ncbi:hypothetical protein [Neobittarella massiliensis]|uniref:Uncharacterized protein n=2 Tax=Oscillospiraceae TaxID=216572 RepID=A0A8J6IKZ8_9FIRM|nr:hypothetical protein [Neobittarella massiliensis]MBC3515549.1 hypothetical protein [Neobittarella massiliensis]SCJ54272.1 Uncharacterised protein [uncultured Anaerotruncus sp.]
MAEELYYRLGLSDLLDQDLSAYEYYCSQPVFIKRKLDALDIGSFEELQRAVGMLAAKYTPF